jgi:membrane protein implicated in regulation of membrane protease activity
MAAALMVAALYALHQDFWFWREARPLVFGFMPIGLFYHAAYTAIIAVVLAWLVRAYWPAHLDEDAGSRREKHK